jgi:hypothetical protein
MGTPDEWMGWFLIVFSACSALIGALYTVGQRDLKRLLGYSSTENVGIAGIGFGVGCLGLSWNNPVLVALGFAGGLLHVLNHAFFKCQLFYAAGAVYQAKHTVDMERLGGLARLMPWTAGAFWSAAWRSRALPPFNGFASEFVIYSGLFSGQDMPVGPRWPCAGSARCWRLSARCRPEHHAGLRRGVPRRAARPQPYRRRWRSAAGCCCRWGCMAWAWWCWACCRFSGSGWCRPRWISRWQLTGRPDRPRSRHWRISAHPGRASAGVGDCCWWSLLLALRAVWVRAAHLHRRHRHLGLRLRRRQPRMQYTGPASRGLRPGASRLMVLHTPAEGAGRLLPDETPG